MDEMAQKIAALRCSVIDPEEPVMSDIVERLRASCEDGIQPDDVYAAASEIERLRADIQAYRGALGYAVPGEFGERLSDGTVPNNGIAEAVQAENSRLRAERAAAERDALRWWRYVDPFDMYSEDEEAWRKWQRISEERQP